jgi:hypothetical protein
MKNVFFFVRAVTDELLFENSSGTTKQQHDKMMATLGFCFSKEMSFK